jgi:hypothetical protein
VAQSDQRPPTEVGDQEADLADTIASASAAAEHIDRPDRRRRLDRRQQRFKLNGDRRRSSISP